MTLWEVENTFRLKDKTSRSSFHIPKPPWRFLLTAPAELDALQERLNFAVDLKKAFSFSVKRGTSQRKPRKTHDPSPNCKLIDPALHLSYQQSQGTNNPDRKEFLCYSSLGFQEVPQNTGKWAGSSKYFTSAIMVTPLLFLLVLSKKFFYEKLCETLVFALMSFGCFGENKKTKIFWNSRFFYL